MTESDKMVGATSSSSLSLVMKTNSLGETQDKTSQHKVWQGMRRGRELKTEMKERPSKRRRDERRWYTKKNKTGRDKGWKKKGRDGSRQRNRKWRVLKEENTSEGRKYELKGENTSWRERKRVEGRWGKKSQGSKEEDERRITGNLRVKSWGFFFRSHFSRILVSVTDVAQRTGASGGSVEPERKWEESKAQNVLISESKAITRKSIDIQESVKKLDNFLLMSVLGRLMSG